MPVIVITGGPCAGKTTAMSWVQNAFSDMGYNVLFISETATELITGGVAPWTCVRNQDYQLCQMKMQLEKEKIYFEAAKVMKNPKVLVVCDRGAMDNRAYMNQQEFDWVLGQLGEHIVSLRERYDAVFHLTTAAKGAEQFYTMQNNAARYETVQEARDLDDRLMAAWTGHPHLRVIGNQFDFENKMKSLIEEIRAFLGEPRPYEVERKYLIEYPDVQLLDAMPNCRCVDIVQTYLKTLDGSESRIRQRGEAGHYVYYETSKRPVGEATRIELERRLTADEYLQLLMTADPTRRPISKKRYCLTHMGQYFELDLYPFWNHQALLELEMESPDKEVVFPDFIKVIREVTNDARYSNGAMSRSIDGL